jgi:hypothetical protein
MGARILTLYTNAYAGLEPYHNAGPEPCYSAGIEPYQKAGLEPEVHRPRAIPKCWPKAIGVLA